MKKSTAAASTIVLAVASFAGTAWGAVTIRYENRDSVTYQAEAVCSGSKQPPVEIKGSTTSAVTIQGSAPCKLTLGGQTIELTKDADVLVKDGKITLK